MKCSSCGKKFDYEKYYGICPKCGAYTRKPTGEEVKIETPQKMYEGGIKPLKIIIIIVCVLIGLCIGFGITAYNLVVDTKSTANTTVKEDSNYPFQLLEKPMEKEKKNIGEYF